MGSHIAPAGSKNRVVSALVLGALTSGALALASLGSAGTANATCASFSGIASVGHGCSTAKLGDTAIAIGPGTVASASGGFNTSIAVGNGAEAHSSGVANLSVGIGGRGPSIFGPDDYTYAETDGTFNRAIALGRANTAYAGDLNVSKSVNNTALVLGRGSRASAGYTDGPNNRISVAVGKLKSSSKGFNNGDY